MDKNRPPDFAWYQQKSAKHGAFSHCPIGSIDKCPRYFQSLRHIEYVYPGALLLEPSQIEQLEEQWKFADSLCNPALVVGISGNERIGIHSLEGFCPEVCALYLGLYCSSFRKFADEIHRDAVHQQLLNNGVNRDDLQWKYSHVEAKHFTECKELAIYAPPLQPKRQSRKRANEASQKDKWTTLARDEFTCRYCGAKGGNGVVLEVDHIVSIAEGGGNDLSNLVTSCSQCNNGKGARSAVIKNKI